MPTDIFDTISPEKDVFDQIAPDDIFDRIPDFQPSPERNSRIDAGLDFFNRTHPQPEQGPGLEKVDSMAPAMPQPEPIAPQPSPGAFSELPQKPATGLDYFLSPPPPVRVDREPIEARRGIDYPSMERPENLSPLEALRKPTEMPVPRLSDSEAATLMPPWLAPHVAGVQRSMADFVDFATSPAGIATTLTGGAAGEEAIAGKLVSKATARAFALDMAQNLPDQFDAAVSAIQRGDKAEATRAMVNGAAALLMIGHAAKLNAPGGVRPETALNRPQSVSDVSRQGRQSESLPQPAVQPTASPAIEPTPLEKVVAEMQAPRPDVTANMIDELRGALNKNQIVPEAKPEVPAATPGDVVAKAVEEKPLTLPKEETPPQTDPFDQIRHATQLDQNALDRLGVYRGNDESLQQTATRLSANAPGGYLNQLYDHLTTEDSTGRFTLGGAADNPKIGFDPDVSGGRLDPVAARRALDAVNTIRRLAGMDDLPDFFQEKPPSEAGVETPGTRETLPSAGNVTPEVTQASGVKPVKVELGKYTILDSVKDNGGLGGPSWDAVVDALRKGSKPADLVKAYGGEYDALGDIIEQVQQAIRGKNRAQFNALRAAYRRAGFGGGKRIADVTLQGMQQAQQRGEGIANLPTDTNELITRVWDEASGRGAPTPEGQAEKFWKAVDDPNSKIGLQKVNVQDLHVGDKFRIRGKGISHEELTVSHLDPDTGEVQVKDGPKLGTTTLPDGAEIWVQKGTHVDAKGHLREEPPLFGKPESVEEQKARLALEAKRKAEAAQREEIARRQAKPLIGKQGDIGQKDLFGGGDLFSEEATHEALDRNALHFYGRSFDEITPEQQEAIRRAVIDEKPPVQGREQIATAPRGESVAGREPVQTERLPERPSSEVQRTGPAAESRKLSLPARKLLPGDRIQIEGRDLRVDSVTEHQLKNKRWLRVSLPDDPSKWREIQVGAEERYAAVREAGGKDAVETFLDKAIEATDPGQQLGGSQVSLGLARLPVWLTKQVAHDALKVVRAAYRASKDVLSAVQRGIDHIRQFNLPGFNEVQARRWLRSGLPEKGRLATLDKLNDYLESHDINSPKMTLPERADLAWNSVKASIGAAKDTATVAWARTGALWKAAVAAYKRPVPEGSDFRNVIKQWHAMDTRTLYQTYQMQKAFREKVSNPLRRSAITVWLQAGGDMAELSRQGSNVPEKYKPVWDAAQKLTPEELDLADQIKADWQDKLRKGVNAGLVEQAHKDYAPQVWKKAPQVNPSLEPNNPGSPFAKLDTRKPFFYYEKSVPNYYEGIMAKGVPKTLDVADLVGYYNAAFNKAVSSRGVVRLLADSKAADGKPVTILSGRAEAVPNETGGEDYMVNPKYKAAAVSADGRPYKTIDHPALQDWKWVNKTEQGDILMKGDMLVHPDHYKFLKNVLGTSALREVPGVKQLLKASYFLKSSKFSLAPFHIVTEGEHALSHLVSPFLTDADKIDFRDPVTARLIRGGVDFGVNSPHELFSEGMSSHGGLFSKIPGLGQMASALSTWTFKDYIPELKIKVGRKILERNEKRYSGKLTRDQIDELTAKQVNAAFGGQNYRLLGRNQTTLDILRLGLLAPDFLISRAKVVGQALKPYGAEQRRMIMTQVAAAYIGARILNGMLDDDGDPHWEDPFAVYHGGRRYSLRIIASDVVNMIKDPRAFAYGRMAPLLHLGTELLTGRDWRGIKQTRLEQIGDFMRWLLPVGVEGVVPGKGHPETTLASAALQAAGVGSRQATAYQRVKELARDFNRNSADPAVRAQQERDDVESHKESDYKRLDNALQSDDLASAKKEYQKLLDEGKKAPKIAQRYHHEAGFTGSKRRDQQFIATLTPAQRTMLERAKAEKAALYLKFLQATRP